MKPFKAIAAMGKNRAIGHKGALPWHLPDEFGWFKEATMGHTLLMGRKTFSDIGKALPGRRTIILSRSDLSIPKVEILSDWKTLKSSQIQGDLFVCGGAEIYRQLLPYCADLYLSIIDQEPKGDAFFPEFEDRFEKIELLRKGNGWEAFHFRNVKLEKFPD